MNCKFYNLKGAITMNSQIKFKKLIQTALLAALCFVSFTYLQIKIPMPGGDATSLILEMHFVF